MDDTTHTPSPGQTVGPFFHFGLVYPDSNLLVSPDAPGAITVHGVVSDGNGQPVPDALIEVWQPGPAGEAVTDPGHLDRDGTFTGWGRAATDADGRYHFVTLAPGAMREGAAPFIAVAVFARGLLDRLFTRIYLGADATTSDSFLTSLSAHERDTLIARPDGDARWRFDVVLQGERQTTFLTHAAPSEPHHG